jgi:hypothetical protein
MLTKKIRSHSVIFSDTRNDVRRRRFSFNENENAANMKKKSSDMRQNVSSGRRRNDSGRRKSEP